MKKVMLATIAILILSVLFVAPTKAKTVEPYEARIEITLMDPGKQWVSEDGVLHIKDSYWLGTEVSSLGTNKFEDWESFHIDLATGEGTFCGKWLLTIGTQGTISGSARGTLSMGYLIQGMFVGTHGTGEFEGVQKKGSLEGFLTDPTHAVMDCYGKIVYP